MLNGVLWILGTGVRELPQKYPAYQTCRLRPVAGVFGNPGAAARDRGVPAPVPVMLYSVCPLLGMVRLGCMRIMLRFVSDYSYRSATMGSIFAARRAGT